jgi:hypothetical protein
MGREVVVVGTGPTLNKYRPIENAIHVGVNHAFMYEDVDLDFHFRIDFNKGDMDRKSYIEHFIDSTMKVRCKKFVGCFREGCLKMRRVPESYFPLLNAARFFFDVECSKVIYRDISMHPLMSFRSVIFPAIHFALYTNPKTLYLVGCDADRRGYFTDEQTEPELTENIPVDRQLMDWMKGYEKIKEFTARVYPETEIISINPVGLKGMFKDVYTE